MLVYQNCNRISKPPFYFAFPIEVSANYFWIEKYKVSFKSQTCLKGKHFDFLSCCFWDLMVFFFYFCFSSHKVVKAQSDIWALSNLSFSEKNFDLFSPNKKSCPNILGQIFLWSSLKRSQTLTISVFRTIKILFRSRDSSNFCCSELLVHLKKLLDQIWDILRISDRRDPNMSQLLF